MYYSASKGVIVKVVTALVFMLFGFIAVKNIQGIVQAAGNITTVFIYCGSLVFLISVLVMSYSYAPKGYSVTENEVIIHRPAGNKLISLKEIQKIRKVDKSELKGTIRTFGVGGLFGSYGKFYNFKLGKLTLFASQNKNYVLIQTDKKIIITPDDMGLIDEVETRL